MLNISDNPITVIDPFLFDGLKELKELYLRGVSAENINPQLFNGLEKLENVHFYTNQHGSIDSRSFHRQSDSSNYSLSFDEDKQTNLNNGIRILVPCF